MRQSDGAAVNGAVKKKLIFFVSGGGTNMQAVLDAIARGEIAAEPMLVISSNYEAYALQRAKQAGIKTKVFCKSDYETVEQRDEAIRAELKKLRPDYLLLVGYLGILPPAVIDEYAYRIINIHPSLLPRYGGKGCHGIRVHEMVIAAGDEISGATVHFVDKGTDTGQIIRQKSIRVDRDDTPQSLQKKVLENCEYPLIVGVVRDLCNGKIRVENGRVADEAHE